jgi:hypothetical protein
MRKPGDLGYRLRLLSARNSSCRRGDLAPKDSAYTVDLFSR